LVQPSSGATLLDGIDAELERRCPLQYTAFEMNLLHTMRLDRHSSDSVWVVAAPAGKGARPRKPSVIARRISGMTSHCGSINHCDIPLEHSDEDE
jgi:hypothetical protein